MHAARLILSAVCAVAAAVVRRAPGRGCGAPAPSLLNMANAALISKLESDSLAAGRYSRQEITKVPLYIHVVAKGEELRDGYLPKDMVMGQLKVLNDDYKGAGFIFDLQDIDYTINETWARDRSEMDMKRSLRRGTYGDLNLYFQPYVSGYLGYSYFPERNVTKRSQEWYRDGCTILAGTVPGGWEGAYSGGRTVTHEVGHWMGLYHTFEGGCTGDGDFINDTPAELEPAYECASERNSCPGREGTDPIHNFMDYVSDSCMESFTDGQKARMQSYYSRYRA
ncbi:Extracellular metalloprotease [Ceratocystis lukuohia]|uniref:Extracellular metalloprotease n=1 Tax=Ceratocystis lukuohia TaxID=2019550 RepID=A0ABR4M8S8_9PEZI